MNFQGNGLGEALPFSIVPRQFLNDCGGRISIGEENRVWKLCRLTFTLMALA